MSDWLTAIIGLSGVIIGAGIQEYRYWRQAKDKYKEKIFEKRLEVHQGAYYWCHRLLWVIRPNRLIKAGGLEEFYEELHKATDWLNKNALYLDVNTQGAMREFFADISQRSMKYLDKDVVAKLDIKKELREISEGLKKTLTCIEQGIGFKYLPARPISPSELDMEEAWATVISTTEYLIKKQSK